MSIDQMIQASYILLLISVIFAVAAAVMFFAYDIVRCFRSIRHGYSPTKNEVNKSLKTEKLPDENLRTQKLETRVIMENDNTDTGTLELIQDIVCMHDTEEITYNRNSGH